VKFLVSRWGFLNAAERLAGLNAACVRNPIRLICETGGAMRLYLRSISARTVCPSPVKEHGTFGSAPIFSTDCFLNYCKSAFTGRRPAWMHRAAVSGACKRPNCRTRKPPYNERQEQLRSAKDLTKWVRFFSCILNHVTNAADPLLVTTTMARSV
jgi:hypothetical protein